MGIVTPPPQPARPHLSSQKPASRTLTGPNSQTSMSQGFHQGIFSFSDAFDRSTNQEQQHVAQQSRRDKLRGQGFDPAGHPLVPIEAEGEEPSGIYEPPGAANMLSEMFNFTTPSPSATELLANQITGGYGRLTQRPTSLVGFSEDWYGTNRQGGVVLSSGLSSLSDAAVKHHHDGGQQQQQHAMPGLNADSAAAMQLFLMSPPAAAAAPPPQRSPSPPPPAPGPPPPPPSTLHHQAFQAATFGGTNFGGGVVEGQGLSLSLSSSLQQFDVAKAEELRVRDGVLYFNTQQQQRQHPTPLHFGQGQHAQQAQGHTQMYMGYGPVGLMNVLRNSKYSRAAQELLEEFCSVGRGQLNGSRIGRHHRGGSSNPNPNASGGGGASSSAAAGSSSSTKDLPPLSPADRFEHQRKKAKLLSMLDEARVKHLTSLSLSPPPGPACDTAFYLLPPSHSLSRPTFLL